MCLRGLCPHMKNSRLCRGIIVLPFFSCAPGNGSIHSFILIWPFVMSSFMRMPPRFILAVAKPLSEWLWRPFPFSSFLFPRLNRGYYAFSANNKQAKRLEIQDFPAVWPVLFEGMLFDSILAAIETPAAAIAQPISQAEICAGRTMYLRHMEFLAEVLVNVSGLLKLIQ